MIDGLYDDTCDIWRREKTVKYGGRAGSTFRLHKANEPCLFIPKIGKSITTDVSGRSIVVDGTFRLNEEVLINDKISYNGYDYEVLLIQEKKDIVTGVVMYYLAMAQRQRASLEDNKPDKVVRIKL